VDGRNPAPVDRWFIPLFIGFQPSQVVQDFFHPPYSINFHEVGFIASFRVAPTHFSQEGLGDCWTVGSKAADILP